MSDPVGYIVVDENGYGPVEGEIFPTADLALQLASQWGAMYSVESVYEEE